MKKHLIFEFLTAILMVVFLYTGLSKLLDFNAFVLSMRFQHLPGWITTPLIYTLPAIEIAIAAILIPDKTRVTGLYAYLVLMTGFTLYAAAVLLHLFPNAPCACGGVLKGLGWGPHFLLNLLLLILATVALRCKIFHARNQVIAGPVVKSANH